MRTRAAAPGRGTTRCGDHLPARLPRQSARLGLPRGAGLAIETPPLDAIPQRGEILLGYSLGGRLALQALLAGAHYECAIFISTGLGIDDEVARQARRASDEAWAQRFENDDWDAVINAWNAQPVLAGPALPRT